ncbi:MAG TPA: ABC transporter permease [Gemmatimonadaceae bacterium]|nr:ABC transporter permease [Gemmatimonadaceae bacterium]
MTAVLDRLVSDGRFALRGFRRTPGFFVTAVLILGLGIGMSVAMFTVFRTVLVRRLPVTDQDHVVVMWTYRNDPSADYAVGTKELSVVRKQSHTMRDIAAVAHWPATPYPFIDGNRSVTLNRGMVTGNFFDVLGVRPALGRLMKPSDDYPDGSLQRSNQAPSAMVLSYRAWKEQFGGDPGVIGRRLVEPYLHSVFEIVGVAPAGFDYPANADYWQPMWAGWQSGVSAFAVARLQPGATLASARNEYLSMEQRLAPDADFKGAHAATFTETVVGNVRPVIALLSAAVGLLLLIACLNVGNLLLLRASSRMREIAVRRALGASLGDIVVQLLVEASVIAIAGGALGLLVAIALLDALVRFAPSNLPRVDDIQLSGTPLVLAVGVSAAAVLIFGLAPALIAARGSLASPLRMDGRSGGETRRRRAIRQSLVTAQVGLAMLMLGGAALLARSLARLEGQDAGYTTDHVSSMGYSWNAKRQDSVIKMVQLGDRLVHRLREIPGVTAVAQMVAPPLLGDGVWFAKFQVEGQADADVARSPSFVLECAGSDFFKVLGIHIERGRAFTDADGPGSELVAIVSESVANQLWPGQNPIGKRIKMPGGDQAGYIGGAAWRTVVGVAHDTHLRTVRKASPTVYMPSMQGYWQGVLILRSSVDLAALVPALRTAGKDVDPDLQLWNPRTMDDVLAQPLAQPRLGALLMSSFGLVALLLAAIGLYGVMASLVRDQTREIGIRLALGAPASVVRRAVLGRAAIVTGVGVVAGLVLALVSSRLVTSLLFQTSPTDPVSLGAACLVLLGVGALAAYLPARRATRIDPVQALRAD